MGRLNNRHQQFSLVRRANRAQGKTLTRSPAARLWASWRACTAFQEHRKTLLTRETSVNVTCARGRCSPIGGIPRFAWEAHGTSIPPLVVGRFCAQPPHARGNLYLRPVVAARLASPAWGTPSATGVSTWAGMPRADRTRRRPSPARASTAGRTPARERRLPGMQRQCPARPQSETEASGLPWGFLLWHSWQVGWWCSS